jgi:membrane protein
MYYSAQIFLLGAEFTWIYAHAFGSLCPRPHATAGARAPDPSMDEAVQAIAASRAAIASALSGRRRR